MTTFTGEEAAGNGGRGVWLYGPKGEPRLMPHILAFSCLHGVDDHDPCDACAASAADPADPSHQVSR